MSSACFTNLAIIGHRGYIGSYLVNNLVNEKIQLVSGSDELRIADVVIYLGGIVGHQRCQEKIEREVFDANVGDIMRVASNMKQGALLIYASTSALYEGYGMSEPDEGAILNEQVFDRYLRTMYCREANIRTMTNIRSVGLRLGTVIGISPNQKKTSIHIKMLRDAVLFGKVRVSGAHMGRSILWMEDLRDAIRKIIENRDNESAVVKGHEVYNICSFNCTVAKIANEIGCKTGCNVVFQEDTELQKHKFGFSMNTDKVRTRFGIQFRGKNDILVEELIRNIKHVCHNTDYLHATGDEAKCRVCKKSEHMAVLYDFGSQPNANHYLSTVDGKLDEYPLRLDVCRNCYHTQISYTIPPEEVFSDYIYLSGTSNTMRDFFRDFAEKSISESGVAGVGTVLEIACNDGSLLDWYKARGWKTYGYDPARNIHAISSAKGHDVTVGFWGSPDSPMPEYPKLDLIVAQNVCAHVPDPVAFLEACRRVMDDSTILYIQTSQSEMIERGQYDTAYHEHLSFFTVRSMDIASKMAGLCLDGVEKVDVHGSSYVFKLRLQSTSDITQNPIYKYEKELGLYDDLLYYVFVEKVRELSRWLKDVQEKEFAGMDMVAYGAAAKGMTVLNSLDWRLPLKYIADDSPYKHNVYATNRKYLILPPAKLADDSDNLVILVLAWNFIDEIKERTRKLRPNKATYFITTYPQKTIWYISREGKEYKIFEEIDTRYTAKSVYHNNILISHFYNEEALLTQWIRHHAPLFNCAVLIDYNSTDKSREIIRREAPESWNVVMSQNREFGAFAIDAEVAGYENSFDNTDWRLALTTTEFLNTVGLRRQDNPMFHNLGEKKALRIQSITVVDDETVATPNNKSVALLRQINRYYFQTEESKKLNVLTEEEERYVNNHYNRFMHCIRDFQNPYWVGRHQFKHPQLVVPTNLHILKYVYGPFPEFYSRKLQIKTRMPESDKQYNFGHQHLIEYDQLDADYKRKQGLPLISTNDFNAQLAYYDRYMRDVGASTLDQTLYGIFKNMYE